MLLIQVVLDLLSIQLFIPLYLSKELKAKRVKIKINYFDKLIYALLYFYYHLYVILYNINNLCYRIYLKKILLLYIFPKFLKSREKGEYEIYITILFHFN